MHHGQHQLRVPLFDHIQDIAEGRRSDPQADAKFQHYVPQLHLRGFSPNPRPARNARIWQLDKEQGLTSQRRVARTGGETRFNRVLGPDNESTDILEAWFGLVETHAAPSLERLIRTRTAPSLADRLTISFYLALQEARTPHGLAAITTLSDMVLDTHLGVWTRNPNSFAELVADAGLDEHPDVIEEARGLMRRPGSVKMKPADARTEAFRVAFESAADRSDVIVPMEWSLLQSDEALLVGDHPITHHDAEVPDHPWREPGWLSTLTSETVIPLTTHLALKMVPRTRGGKRRLDVVQLRSADAHVLNLRTYGWATRFVFAEDENTLLRVKAAAEAAPHAVPRPALHHEVFTADERAFGPLEPNVQADGWPSHLARPDGHGGWVTCRYRVARADRPDEVRAAAVWSVRAEQRLHPGQTPELRFGPGDALVVPDR